MLFVKTADLKEGMRLARPIYNKNGVLLYERNSKLTGQGIISVKNFGLIGIFILEPAEPVPPMTKDDIEFERFQTMQVFAIQEELTKILQTRKSSKMQIIAGQVIKNYGHLDKKINFVQNLRSKEDYIYKHSLNVSILCAMMTHVLNMKLDVQLDTVIAGVVHDIGKLTAAKQTMDQAFPAQQDNEILHESEIGGFTLIENVFSANPGIKRICAQAEKVQYDFYLGNHTDAKLVPGAKVLAVANMYDTMTAMQFEKEPASEVQALRLLMEHSEDFDETVVNALIRSINILGAGSCIELNSGEKGLVIAPNEQDILRPMILTFHNNNIVDLSNIEAYGDLEISDIMKTMDNRYIMDTSALRRSGFHVDEPEYVEAMEEEEYVPGRDF